MDMNAGYIPVSDLKLFNLADAKAAVSSEKTANIKNQLGELELGTTSIDWIGGLPPEHQMHAYQDFRQHATQQGMSFARYLPDIKDPAELTKTLSTLKWAGQEGMKRLLAQAQIEHTGVETAKAKQEMELAPKKLENEIEDRKTRLAETASRDTNAHLDRMAQGDANRDLKLSLAELAASNKPDPRVGKYSAREEAAINAFTDKNKRAPNAQELPTVLDEANAQKATATTAARTKATRDTKLMLTPSDETLAQQVADGKLAPSQLSKRTDNYNAVLAEAFNRNPEFDAKLSDAEKQLLGNQAFRSRGMTLESVPELLGNVKSAGDKLGYSDVQFFGKVEQWKNGQLNDPNFVEYMTQRNDIILTLANVMRGAGATDQSQKLEEEAFKPTLSPGALDGWVRGQMKAVEPRLKQYEHATGGRDKPAKSTAGIPKDGVTGVSNGRKVIVKNGKWVLNDGN